MHFALADNVLKMKGNVNTSLRKAALILKALWTINKKAISQGTIGLSG
jgi:hypothetical protein